MNFIERITDLRKQEQAIKEEIEGLMNEFEYDEWVFCPNTLYYEPRVTAWKQGDDIDTGATFIIRGEYVQMRSAGMYWNNWKEIENILNKWLSQDFTEEIKAIPDDAELTCLGPRESEEY